MSETPVLRYFDCRSRGQALRFALSHAGPFEDVRVPIEDLTRFREQGDTKLGGPFASLPVLDWGETRVAQTLAIAGYLIDRLDAPDTAEARAFQLMIVSAAHLDMQVPYSGLMWGGAGLNEHALEEQARALLENLVTKLRQLERLHCERLPEDTLFAGAAPGVSDFFAYESIDRARQIFGDAFERELGRCTRMHGLAAAVDALPAVAALHAAGRVSVQVSASPTEMEVRARVRKLDLARD